MYEVEQLKTTKKNSISRDPNSSLQPQKLINDLERSCEEQKLIPITERIVSYV